MLVNANVCMQHVQIKTVLNSYKKLQDVISLDLRVLEYVELQTVLITNEVFNINCVRENPVHKILVLNFKFYRNDRFQVVFRRLLYRR